jgi:hypothetical protein
MTTKTNTLKTPKNPNRHLKPGTLVVNIEDAEPGRIVQVRIDSTNSHGGWNATNTATGKRIRIKSAQHLRWAVPADCKAAQQAEVEVQRLEVFQLDGQQLVVPLGQRRLLVVGDATGLHPLRRQVAGNMHRHLWQAQLLGRLPARVADDGAVAVQDNRLAGTEPRNSMARREMRRSFPAASSLPRGAFTDSLATIGDYPLRVAWWARSLGHVCGDEPVMHSVTEADCSSGRPCGRRNEAHSIALSGPPALSEQKIVRYRRLQEPTP